MNYDLLKLCINNLGHRLRKSESGIRLSIRASMVCCEDCHVKEIKKLGFEGFMAAKIVLAGKNSIPVESIANMKSVTLFYDMPRKNIMTCIKQLGKFYDIAMTPDKPNVLEITERKGYPND